MLCCLFIFSDLVIQSLETFQHLWNNHRIRTQPSSAITGVPSVLYTAPESKGNFHDWIEPLDLEELRDNIGEHVMPTNDPFHINDWKSTLSLRLMEQDMYPVTKTNMTEAFIYLKSTPI